MALTKKQTIHAIWQYEVKDKNLRREFSDLGVANNNGWTWNLAELYRLHDFELDIILLKIMKVEKSWAVDFAWLGGELP